MPAAAPRHGSGRLGGQSSRASHSGAKSVSTPCRKKPSHVLSPRPRCPTRFIPSFQSPVPNSGSPCAPAVMPRSIARTQCSNSVPSSADTRRQSVRLVLHPSASSGACQERHALVEHAGIAGRADVLGDDVRQPEQIVGAAAAKPAAGRLVPPVLHVAFDELPCRGAQQVLARKVRTRERQRHHVLQLIAKAVCAAGLVVSAARPEPAADRLIQQPAVDQRVERIVRRMHLDRVERGVPRALEPASARPSASSTCPWRAISRRAWSRSAPSPSRNSSVRRLSRLQHASNVKRRAGIQPRADLAVRAPREPWRPAADTSPLRPMNARRSAGHGARRLARVRERDVAGELLVVGVSGQHRSARRIHAP